MTRILEVARVLKLPVELPKARCSGLRQLRRHLEMDRADAAMEARR